MVHLVRLSTLVRNYIDQDIHSSVGVVWRGAIPVRESNQFELQERRDVTYKTGTRRTTALASVTPRTASSPSRFVRPYKLSGLVGACGV